MPAYNCGLYIEKAISSILGQSYSDLELLISDDASTDDTWDIIQSFDDKRIRTFRQETNLGLLKNFNFLLTKVEGDFVTCQDADDWSEHHRLRKQIEIFNRFPDVHLVGCSGGFQYNSGKVVRCPPFIDGYVSIETEIQPFILPAILYRRKVLEKVNGFHMYFDGATSMDQYFIFNILSLFKGYAFDSYLYTHRFNPVSSTRNLDNFRKATAHEAYLLLRKQRLESGSDWLMEGREGELLEFEKSLLTNSRFMSEKYREYGVYRLDAGQINNAIPFFWKSLTRNPFNLLTYRSIGYLFKKLFSYR